MLVKTARLSLRREFHKVASGKRLESGPAKIYYLPGDGDKPQIGISVSGKIFKKATDRNRSRRLLSRGFETFYSQLIPGLKIIAMPRESVLVKSADDITKSLEKAFREAGLLKQLT